MHGHSRVFAYACGLALLTGCGSLPTIQGVNLQSIANVGQKVGEAQKEFTQEEEIALGGNMASILLGAARLDPDAQAQAYVNRVGRWLANRSERPDLPWHFGVLHDPNINAYAAPGGYVFITRGLLDELGNEAELAGVLAHEIAHVLKKHHLMAMKAGASREAWGEFAHLAADQYQSRHGDQAGKIEITKKLLGTTVQLYTKGLDREDEFEADRMGVVLALRAGYDGYALMSVLQGIERHGAKDSTLALMFKTHPNPAERLERLDATLNRVSASSEELGEARFREQMRLP